MKIVQCISTMDGILPPQGNNTIDRIVINQGKRTEKKSVYNSDTVGLSKSRNLAIELLPEKSVAIVSDNDVALTDSVQFSIEEAYKRCKDADIITFKAMDYDGSDFKKRYSQKSFRHNIFTIFRVSSIEITIKKESFDDSFLFDESYGLGTNVPIGAENIFLADMIKKGKKVYYYPLYIAKHLDSEHTGLNFSVKYTLYRKLVFQRVFGNLTGRFVLILFLLKKLPNLSGNFFSHLNIAFK